MAKRLVPALVGQLARFGLVGLSNTLLSLAAFELLRRTGLPGTASASIAFLVGALNGYPWNRRWTFRAADTRAARMRYLIIQAAGLALTSGLFDLFAHAVPAPRAA